MPFAQPLCFWLYVRQSVHDQFLLTEITCELLKRLLPNLVQRCIMMQNSTDYILSSKGQWSFDLSLKVDFSSDNNLSTSKGIFTKLCITMDCNAEVN